MLSRGYVSPLPWPPNGYDVSGTVEGTLMVSGILTVRASGRVRGQTISYGELVIERDGTVIGTVRRLPEEGE